MTQSKHTPGPWLRADAEEPDTEIIVSMGFTVATVWGGFADRVANARLIAAAPDLFRAASAFIEAEDELIASLKAEGRHTDILKFDFPHMRALRAAVAKAATGEG